MTNKSELLSTPAHVSVSAISNAGGEGKTTIAIAVDAALDLLGRPPQLIDIDQGMGSLAFQREDAKSLDWGMPQPKADVVFERIRDRDVVFDFGANLLASGAPVVRLYNALTAKLAEVGFRRIVLVPISPNKPGAVGAAREIISALSHMECHAVLVNRDNSAAYDEDVSGLGALMMPHLQPALQEFRVYLQKALGISMADAMRSPPEGWTCATDYLGTWLRAFATQPRMIDILGGDIGPVLDRLGRRAQPPLSISNLTKNHLHDDDLGKIQRLSAFFSRVQENEIWRVLDAHGLTPAGLRATADELERNAPL